MAKIYKNAAELVGNTPLLEVGNLEKELGLEARILVKLEYFNPAGSAKDRIALSMIEDAEERGVLKPGAVIIEPTSGNTGIGLASLAAIKGYRVILTMPETMSVERRNILKAYGAELVLTDGTKGMKGAIARANELAEEIPNSFYQAANISEAVSEALKKHKVPESERHARIGNLFAHFDLAQVSKAKASELDSEKRHLLAIAAALSFEPSAIVADEPSKGLDEIGAAHVAKALFSYNKQVIFATHDTDMIRRPEYAIDRVLVLDEHAVAFDGAPAEAVAFYEDLIRRKYEAAKR